MSGGLEYILFVAIIYNIYYVDQFFPELIALLLYLLTNWCAIISEKYIYPWSIVFYENVFSSKYVQQYESTPGPG